jgi:predicted nucleotidyltransferase
MDYNAKIMSTLNLLRIKRAEILALAIQHGASNVRLFGSVVRGEDREDSDIDFLVDMQETRSLFDLIGLQQDIERVLGKKVDVLTPNGINRYLKDRILGESVPL